MIKQNNLFEIVQNVAVSTIAIQSFVLGYYDVAKHKKEKIAYPKLEYLFYVLPIVYHECSMNTFKSSQFLHTALMSDKSIILGLQDRAIKMSRQTFDALNLAFCKKILYLNLNNRTIELSENYNKRKLPLTSTMNTSDNRVKKYKILLAD